MVDLLEHPVVGAVRRLAADAEQAAREASPTLSAAATTRRDDLLRAIHATREAVHELHDIMVDTPVVTVPGSREYVQSQVGRLLSLHVALWQSLPHLRSDVSITSEVRREMVEAMREISDVMELVFFKLDLALASHLQGRLAALPPVVTPTDDWREVLAGL